MGLNPETLMSAKLVAEEGALKDLVLSFQEGDQWTIGRDPDSCQLLVEDPAVSRRHVFCRKTPEGIIVENLSVTNPLLVNAEIVEAPRLLQHGDMVKIGDTFFRYYVESEVVHLFDEKEEKEKSETNIPEKSEVAFPTTAPPELEEEEKAHDTIFEEEAKEQKSSLAQVNFDLMETGRWLLKVVSGPNNGAEFSMQSGNNYVIGTDPNSCDIVFYDNSVSRQHARISISHDDKITIEDLRSRNGTRLDGELISSAIALPFNTLVAIGTSSFVVYDREGEMQTIISPLLPSIVKVLQKEEAPTSVSLGEGGEQGGENAQEMASAATKRAGAAKSPHVIGGLILTAILIGLFGVIGLAVQTLFLQELKPIEKTLDVDATLQTTLGNFPYVKYSFNKATGRLLLVGHVLTPTDKSQLTYNLQGMSFIRDIDDSGVIIDEFVLNEANQTLSRNPAWRGVSVHVPAPGKFVLSGYLQTRDQASEVWDYLTRNFPYIDLLDNKIVVEENIISSVNNMLYSQGLNHVSTQISNGELSLGGSVPIAKKEALDDLVTQMQQIPGIRSVRNVVAVQGAAEAVINISDRYQVSGISRADSGQLSVIVNGRILTVGDVLDGMKVTSIEPSRVMLEKDGIAYRIDISR